MSNQFCSKTAALVVSPASLSLLWMDQAQAKLKWINGVLCWLCVSFRLILWLQWVCLLRPRQHEVRSAEASFLSKSYDNGVISLQTLLTVLWCVFFPSRCIRIWKRVGKACPSQPITCCPCQPPVWETSPHWISPMMRNCLQTPATPLTHKKRVSVVWVNKPPHEPGRDETVQIIWRLLLFKIRSHTEEFHLLQQLKGLKAEEKVIE